MEGIIKSLCSMSLLCGAAVSLAPEGSAKRVMQVVCSVILLTMMLRPLATVDPEDYSLELGRIREREAEFLESGAEAEKRMHRAVIEQQCETYIEDKAAALGLNGVEAAVTARWNTEGLWLPHSVRLSCPFDQTLSEYLAAEFGLPLERQNWSGSDG